MTTGRRRIHTVRDAASEGVTNYGIIDVETIAKAQFEAASHILRQTTLDYSLTLWEERASRSGSWFSCSATRLKYYCIREMHASYFRRPNNLPEDRAYRWSHLRQESDDNMNANNYFWLIRFVGIRIHTKWFRQIAKLAILMGKSNFDQVVAIASISGTLAIEGTE